MRGAANSAPTPSFRTGRGRGPAPIVAAPSTPPARNLRTPRTERTGRSARSMANDPLWYKDAILYELHVKAYSDGNGDGMGDFGGLLARLDHIQQLGGDCSWLLPMYPSPL